MVMCLHRCLIIKDNDKRIKCHSEDSGYSGLFPTGEALSRAKEQGGKPTVTQGKQAASLPVCSTGAPQEYWGDNW